MSNKLMTAAALLHGKIEREEMKDFMASIGDNFNPKHFRDRRLSSSKVWPWGLSRWGRSFSLEEYRVRQLGD